MDKWTQNGHQVDAQNGQMDTQNGQMDTQNGQMDPFLITVKMFNMYLT